MSVKEDYVYAAILSHISWQQVATGPVYKLPELIERLDKATGVSISEPVVKNVLKRMSSNGLAEVIDTGIAGSYIKINYKPVNEYVTGRIDDISSPEYQYRIVGKRLLVDILGGEGSELQASEADSSPPPVLSEEARGRLVVELGNAIVNLDSLAVSNETKAQASSYISAARYLAEAPEPPVAIIWDLINRANALSGIASLFVAIIALFGT